MNTLEPNNSNSIKPTPFDLIKLKNLKLGEFYDGELGNWRTLAYKNHYVLILLNHYDKNEFSEFETIQDLIDCLNN